MSLCSSSILNFSANRLFFTVMLNFLRYLVIVTITRHWYFFFFLNYCTIITLYYLNYKVFNILQFKVAKRLAFVLAMFTQTIWTNLDLVSLKFQMTFTFMPHLSFPLKTRFFLHRKLKRHLTTFLKSNKSFSRSVI